MTDFILYLFKSGVALSIFYLLYFVFLRKETFYNLNRFYLLVTLIVSFILPFLTMEFSRPSGQMMNNFEFVEHAFLEASETLESVELKTVENMQSFPAIYFLLIVGMMITAVRIGYQLYCIYKNVKTHELKTKEKYTHVLMDKNHSTHSFFNFIFVQKSAFKNDQIKEMLYHEYVHAEKLHSLDLLIVGFLSILQWFNPFIYLYKRALTETHEFQADRALLDSGTDKTRYQQLLLDQTRSIVFAGLTSNFNQSLIKNRLKMMNKIKSSNRTILKYLFVFPLVFFIGIFFAISQEKIDRTINNSFTIIEGKNSFKYDKDELRFDARDSIVVDGDLWTLFGDARAETFHAALKSDIIYIDKKEKTIYAYSNDYVPSISPIDASKLERVPSGFGMRMHPILKVKRMHNGMDFAAATGTPIFATANGKVREATFDKNFGNYVIVDHGNGFSTAYMHMVKFKVKEGESVSKGDVIGHVGNTGMSSKPHLHYEVMKDGKHVDPKDYIDSVKN